METLVTGIKGTLMMAAIDSPDSSMTNQNEMSFSVLTAPEGSEEEGRVNKAQVRAISSAEEDKQEALCTQEEARATGQSNSLDEPPRTFSGS